jgi:6-pyruvoyltetrahydropterin/6-carboxytetrahydropterin synthase
MYYSTKRWGHERGLSCAFRQWRATSHCNTLHGYSIAVKLVFGCNHLDDRNWCLDFGGFSEIKKWLDSKFDHKTLVASDDPHITKFEELAQSKIIDMVEVDNVGCEAFAKMVYDMAENWLHAQGMGARVWLVSAEVSEHESNSAIYTKE